MEVLSPQRILEKNESLQGAQDNSIPPWEAIKDAYAPTQVELDLLIQEARAKIPFVKEEGISYIGFQQALPSRSKGHCHGLFFNPFNQSSFPQGLYWPDVALQIKEILHNGSCTNLVQIYPIDGSLAQGSVQHQGHGIMAYGADGPYDSGVMLFAVAAIVIIGAKLSGQFPEGLTHDLATIVVQYTRHATPESRCVYIAEGNSG